LQRRRFRRVPFRAKPRFRAVTSRASAGTRPEDPMPPPTGVADLSIITDRLIAIIKGAMTAAAPGFPFVVSGSMPESVRAEGGGCQISFYLYYVGVDPNARNSPVTGPEISRQRPLGLELYY